MHHSDGRNSEQPECYIARQVLLGFLSPLKLSACLFVKTKRNAATVIVGGELKNRE